MWVAAVVKCSGDWSTGVSKFKKILTAIEDQMFRPIQLFFKPIILHPSILSSGWLQCLRVCDKVGWLFLWQWHCYLWGKHHVCCKIRTIRNKNSILSVPFCFYQSVGQSDRMREIQEPACHNDSSKQVIVDVADLPLSVFLKSDIFQHINTRSMLCVCTFALHYFH